MTNFNVLSIGSERNLFVKDSEAQKRIQEYGQLFNELHIIVFADKALGFKNIEIAKNIFVYPTNHAHKILYWHQVLSIVAGIVTRHTLSAVTAQDPFEAGLVGWLLKLRFHLPLQLQIHADIFSSHFKAESLKNGLKVLIAKFLLPKADGIRVVSERIKQSLVSNVKCRMSNVSVLPIFVDVKKIQSAKIKMNLHQKYPEYDFIILIASRLTKEKNIGMAIKAMKELSQRLNVKSKMLLLIVGEGPEQKNIQLLITNYQLRNNIILEPWTNDLISYYKTADLFLLTSNYEGYGRTVIEAMAAGLPVIMADVGIAGEVLINDLDGQVVPIGDIQVLTEAILELIKNPAKREEFKLNSLKLLEKWPTKQEYLEKYKNSLDFDKMLK
ncbi:MAG: hypothetical protein A3J63_01710 [Candidatus Moranbacteria bacterium RIFCSPHIGHO2_02_FULL_40_12b]|nr:MAG: hypothetical protein A3J63_01710 [Candidatus Moranbacteria bacterium RIFCSPHIGHO2_02_FULL_40_12b]